MHGKSISAVTSQIVIMKGDKMLARKTIGTNKDKVVRIALRL